MMTSRCRRSFWTTMRAFAGVALAAIFTAGCASKDPKEQAERPAHPFPRWVAHLEAGRTDIAEVLAVFGDPAEIEQHARGGLVWRYAHPEVHWAPHDPDRPDVGADGRPAKHDPTWVDRGLEGLAKTGNFLEGLLFYPPRRAEGRRTRTMNATVHDLELRFEIDGTLGHYRYVPRQGRVRVPLDGGA